MLVVVEGDDCGRTLSTEGKVIQYEEEFPCHKLEMNNLMRRRLDECFTTHEEEADVHYCGHAGRVWASAMLVLVSLVGVLGMLC